MVLSTEDSSLGSTRAELLIIPASLALSIPKNFLSRKGMEVRGLEPLTSGLQSPRSAKLSYTPIKTGVTAGA